MPETRRNRRAVAAMFAAMWATVSVIREYYFASGTVPWCALFVVGAGAAFTAGWLIGKSTVRAR